MPDIIYHFIPKNSLRIPCPHFQCFYFNMKINPKYFYTHLIFILIYLNLLTLNLCNTWIPKYA